MSSQAIISSDRAGAPAGVFARLLVGVFALLLTLAPTPTLGSVSGAAKPTHISAHFEFYATPGTERTTARLAANAEARFDELCIPLGACDTLTHPIEVTVAEDPARFAAAFPAESAMAEWAVGVAFPQSQVIVLRAHGSALFSVAETFDHELSHVLLYAISKPKGIPRWFTEGVAIWQAGENVVDRLKTATTAALTGNLPTLESLEDHFPHKGPKVSLAYAHSALFVRWLDRRRGPQALPQLFARLGQGAAFEVAFFETYQATPRELSAIWREGVEEAASPFLIFGDEGFIWTALGVFFLLGGALTLARRRKKLAAMGKDEDTEDAWDSLAVQRAQGEDPTVH